MTPTEKQALKNFIEKQFSLIATNNLAPINVRYNLHQLIDAIQEEGKEAIEFKEWCDDNGWMDCIEGEFRRLIITEGGEKDEYKTTSELYDLFLTNKYKTLNNKDGKG
jgi:hypothetical protein